MPPTVPIDHDCRPENQQNRTTKAALFHYSMLTYSKRPACLEHSNLFKVNVPNSPTAAIKSRRSLREHREPPGSARLSADRSGRARRTPTTATPRPANWTRPTPHARARARAPKSNYELFNCNNFNIRYWSWNYRGCWHQTCPPIVPR